jgi:hypothetical protein
MKTMNKTITIVLLAILSFSVTELSAQSETNGNKTSFSIETDPSTFAFGGYAFHFRIKPANSKHLLIGAGTYAMDYPDFLIGMNPENKDKGWNVRIAGAYSAFGEYYFKEANNKWFVGLQAGIQNYKISNDSFPDTQSTYSNLLIMPSIGYTWHPFKFPLYLKPWMGIGYTTKVSGNNSVSGMEYNIAPLVPFVTLHLGYTF